MKIAIVTDDGKRISNHFGQAPYYRILTIDDHQIIADEIRPKPFHKHGERNGHHHNQNLHEDMFSPISDCGVLLCGGMGEPAYHKAIMSGLEVILTGKEISESLDAYLSNSLISELRRIHKHRDNH